MLRTLSLAAALALAFATNAQHDTCTTDIATVAQHIGEIVFFCGTPSQVSAPENIKGDPVYLNFGGKYPDHTFTVVVWGDVAGKQRKKLEQRYAGKTLRIHGWVKERKGKPEIQVKALEDIEVE